VTQTSIPVDSGVRDRLAEDKPEDMSWSEYLSVLHSDQEIVVENDGGNSSAIDYDDVLQACRSAIREELPVEQMGH